MTRSSPHPSPEIQRPRVLNKHAHGIPADAVYCGRGSHWGTKPTHPLAHPATTIALNLARLAAMDASHPRLATLMGRRRALNAFAAFTKTVPAASILTMSDLALYTALTGHIAGIRFLACATIRLRPDRASDAVKREIIASYGRTETAAAIARRLGLTKNTVIGIAHRARNARPTGAVTHV